MNWFFPPNEGGQEYGFHDAGVETFKGNINRYIARESIQNSIDAQSDKTAPVIVKFEKRIIKTEKQGWLSELKLRFHSCAEYLATDKDGRAFFERGAKLIEDGEIPVLKISDFNTTGVHGKDTERGKGWYSLVKSSGSSSKSGSEGGSFGIGKNAPFAAGALRTVLYSTFNTKGDYIFQGVARLVTHRYGKKTAQNVGYLGENNTSVRKQSSIPQEFRRREHGTDIFILGYDLNSSWQEDLKFSVLENFWVAIMKEKLVVFIDGEKIDADSLPVLMESFSAKDSDFKAHHYYKAATSPERIECLGTLENLGDVYLSLIDGTSDLPKRIAMVRSTGMVIFEKQYRSIVNFAGFFFCDNEKGNAKLREMEPPRHDAWDKDRPEPGDNRRTWKELDEWLRDNVRSLKSVEISQVSEIPDLYRWLPDDKDSETPNSESGSEDKPPESPDKNPIEEIPFIPIRLKPEPKEPKPKPDEPNRIPLVSRVYIAESESSLYKGILRSEKTDTANVRVSAVGDDSQPVPVQVVKAWTDDGSLDIDEKGVIKNLSLTAGEDKKIYIQINSADRLSLEVSAHEA